MHFSIAQGLVYTPTNVPSSVGTAAPSELQVVPVLDNNQPRFPSPTAAALTGPSSYGLLKYGKVSLSTHFLHPYTVVGIEHLQYLQLLETMRFECQLVPSGRLGSTATNKEPPKNGEPPINSHQ